MSFDAQDSGESDRRPFVTEVEAIDLFGNFSHKVTLADGHPFAIVIGPNGIGKTRLFELTRAALTCDRRTLAQTAYASFSIHFSDNLKITYTTHQEEELVLKVSLTDENGKSVSSQTVHGMSDAGLQELDRYVPHPRIAKNAWWDEDAEQEIDAERAAALYAPHLRTSYELDAAFAPYIRDDGATLIETQRLLPRRGAARTRPMPRRLATRVEPPAVVRNSEELSRALQERFAESGSIGQELDRTFARRVLERKPPISTENSVRDRYLEQVAFRNRLVRIGIADPTPEVELPGDSLQDIEVRVMEEYLSDSEKKLNIFLELLDRIELMQEIIGDKFLHKKFTITRNGYAVASEDPTPRDIPLDALSSGEQHELVLTYNLLFGVSPQSLVLIDEPELSLHVAWQRRFLSDLVKIGRLVDVRFMVATHSPQIIDEWWDYTTELESGWE